jgi:formamidopyrimidine-DNA glycosylase
MPELPEVETVVRTLRPRLVGRIIESVWWSGARLHLARPPAFAALRKLCAGARVSGVRRRGKYILVDLEARGVVLVHLGMTGRLGVVSGAAPRAPHTHLVWRLAGGDELRFADARRFGWVRPAARDDALPELAALGPDPLAELTEARLGEALRASRAPLKAFLVDQRRIAGVGNIYACEGLFRARLHPRREARRAARRAGALLAGVREALTTAIGNRGTTFRDFRDGDGEAGENQDALLVYGRAGEPCPACGAALRRIVQAGRSTFFCGRCQR